MGEQQQPLAVQTGANWYKARPLPQPDLVRRESGYPMQSQRVLAALAAFGAMILVAQAEQRRRANDVETRAPAVERPMVVAAGETRQPVSVQAAAPSVAVMPARIPQVPKVPAVVRGTPVAVQTPAQGGLRETDRLEITNAERISIKIQGQTELSGDYRINDDHTISVPVVGRVSVAGLDAAGLEKTLSERLSRLIGREAYVTVEVTEYRPVFISGYVSKPGTAPWKPGMTVLQAVTVSGGTFRGSDSTGVDGASTKLQRTVEDQKRVLATIARLSAEQQGRDKMEIPPRLIALVGRAEAETLIEAQLTSFLSRKSATEAQVSGLKRAVALAKQEIDSIAAQRARLTEQLKFRRAQLAQLKVLYDKQFLRLDRLTEEELKIAELEEKLASLGVSLSRTQGGLIGFERDLGNLSQDRRALIDTDLLKLERDAAQLEVEIEAAGPLPRKLAKPLSDADAAGAPKKDAVIYEIVRTEAGGPRTITVDRNTLVKPGDMVVVSLQ